MLSGALLLAGLLVAGWWFGRWRRGRNRTAKRGLALLGWAVLGVAVCIPIGALLLAKLFDSDVLGWVFGLSLMAELALLPCLVVVGVGYMVGSRAGPPVAQAMAAGEPIPAVVPPRAEAPAAQRVPDDAPGAKVPAPSDSAPKAPARHYAAGSARPLALMALRVDRDSVHAGDDVERHAQTFMVEPGGTLAAFLQQLRRSGFFPSISGGEATWVVESAVDASQRRLVGVCAQQWPEARLMPGVDGSTTLAALFGSSAAGALHFRYWCQVDPARVLACMVSGEALPPPYS